MDLEKTSCSGFSLSLSLSTARTAERHVVLNQLDRQPVLRQIPDQGCHFSWPAGQRYSLRCSWWIKLFCYNWHGTRWRVQATCLVTRLESLDSSLVNKQVANAGQFRYLKTSSVANLLVKSVIHWKCARYNSRWLAATFHDRNHCLGTGTGIWNNLFSQLWRWLWVRCWD